MDITTRSAKITGFQLNQTVLVDGEDVPCHLVSFDSTLASKLIPGLDQGIRAARLFFLKKPDIDKESRLVVDNNRPPEIIRVNQTAQTQAGLAAYTVAIARHENINEPAPVAGDIVAFTGNTNANFLQSAKITGTNIDIFSTPVDAETGIYNNVVDTEIALKNISTVQDGITELENRVAVVESASLPRNYYDVRFEYVGTRSAKVLADSIVKSRDNTSDILADSDLLLDLDTSGAGGLDSGSITSNAWYYPYLIYNPSTDTSSVIASLTNEAGGGNITLPSGFTKKRQLQTAIYLDGSSNILPFKYFPGEKKTLFENVDTLATPYMFLRTAGHFPAQTPVAAFAPGGCKRIVLHAFHEFANTPGQGNTAAILYHANLTPGQIRLGYVTAQNADQNSNTQVCDVLLNNSGQLGFAKGVNSTLTLATMSFYMDEVI